MGTVKSLKLSVKMPSFKFIVAATPMSVCALPWEFVEVNRT